jgi:outer membrane protein TolC
VGLADLRTALLNRKESERARDGAASEALSTLLQAYWELWYAQRALDIQRDARTLAVQQLEEARKKVLAGSAAEFDSLTYETQAASLDQAVLAAEITVRARAIDVNRAMGRRQSEEGLDVSGSTPMALETTDAAQALAAAQAASYTVAQQAIALELAQNAVRSAGDATRPRLDVQAWAQTQGLGNQALGPAATQVGTFANASANVGVVFELPLSSERHEAQLAQARLAASAAAARLEAARQQVAADTSSELATLEQARKNIALAQRSADVSSRAADAQHKRYLNGSALPIEVQQAEDSLRQARLSVERERVNAVKAQLRLANLTGTLLAKWGLEAGR